jgi:hypothetical protein
MSAFDNPNPDPRTATYPAAINDDGLIVGIWSLPPNLPLTLNTHGFVRNRDGSFSSIDVPGALGTYAFGINSAGEIVGFYVDSSGVGHGFVLSHGVFITLDFPEAPTRQLMTSTTEERLSALTMAETKPLSPFRCMGLIGIDQLRNRL